jgi:hypothetical protein
MCKADGPRSDGPGTRWLRVLPGTQQIVVPYTVCDHTRPHLEVMAELAAAEEAAERARAARELEAPVTSSAEVRAAARARVQASCKAPATRSSRRRVPAAVQASETPETVVT